MYAQKIQTQNGWEVQVITPSVGGLGVVIKGPRGRFAYLPPIQREDLIVPLPRHLLENVPGLKEFVEVRDE